MWSRRLGVSTIEIMYYIVEMQLSAGVSLLAECNYKPELAAPKFGEILTRTGAAAIQVLCQSDGAVRLRRFKARARHPGHADFEVSEDEADAWRSEMLAPLDVPGPLITVDGADLAALDYPGVLRQIQAHL